MYYINLTNLHLLNNKKFAFSCLSILEDRGVVNDSTLEILSSGKKCHELFSCSSGFAIIKQVEDNPTNTVLLRECYDNTGKQRYYKDLIKLNGKSFLVTNHWYGPNKSVADNRTPFLTWIMVKSTKINQENKLI